MPIVFSKHALDQLKRRRIPQRKVIEALKTSGKKKVSFRHRVLRRKRFDDKLLEVVTITEGSRITVITAYYLEE